MGYQTPEEVLAAYESSPQILNREFISNIDWSKAGGFPLSPQLVEVLVYMRDIERFTEHYADELRKSPTGRDPIISQFLDRWGEEEQVHGQLLHRFLVEAGMPEEDKWFERFLDRIPRTYWLTLPIQQAITRVLGESFSAVHMTWGAIQELSTLAGYQKVIQLTDNPTLLRILKAIKIEESRHARFYMGIAHSRLRGNRLRQRLTRFFINNFWQPVGGGIKSRAEVRNLLTTLFGGYEGYEFINRRVTNQLRDLPGMSNCYRPSLSLKKLVYSRA